MWEAYRTAAMDHPFWMAALQFAVLGTLGEVLSARIRQGAFGPGIRPTRLGLKALGWALLGIYIKGMFLVAGAGVRELAAHGVLPAFVAEEALGPGPLLVQALSASVLMNVMLGPSMVLLHRLWDNGLDRMLGLVPAGWKGIDQALWTLVWLWIPLHTFTFTQPREVRVGIAAVLSLLLGVVMGWTGRRRPDAAGG
ncbi:MAG TPA: hypothetical protein PLQ97_10020 [Myxococcota bacterium]|nr:hypothetical protein [Myxococcota bacterium]HQK51215.1 hypothetical protein [Myxococcota bacterium]